MAYFKRQNRKHCKPVRLSHGWLFPRPFQLEQASKIKKNEPILVDFGISYHGYHMDQTRMYAIGSMPDLFIKAYEACKESLSGPTKLLVLSAKISLSFPSNSRKKWAMPSITLAMDITQVRFSCSWHRH